MSNLTLRVPPHKAQELKERLVEWGFREVEGRGALWSLTDGRQKVTLYPSGTLLIQGKDSQALKRRVLSLIESPEGIQVGCDESGKGDVFGPLVVCCAVIKPEYYTEVLSLNMRDCKKMKDEEVLKKAMRFKSFGEFSCKVVEPEELNELYKRVGNLNRLLDMLYAELIVQFVKKYPSADFYVDAYAHKNPFGGRVRFEHRGEENLAVATASVLARGEFLNWLARHDLPKGSSPQVMDLARRLYRENPDTAKRLLKVFFL